MLAVEEQAWAMIAVALIGAIAGLVNTLLLKRTTLAGLAQRMADKLLEIDSKVDRLDVVVREVGGRLAEHLEGHGEGG
jgi:hypothetical protein